MTGAPRLQVQTSPGQSGEAAAGLLRLFAWSVTVQWHWFFHLPLPFPFPWLLRACTGLCPSTARALTAELFVAKADPSSQELCGVVRETAEALSVPTWKSLSEADCTVVFQTGACSRYPCWRAVMMHVGSHNAERINFVSVYLPHHWHSVSSTVLIFSAEKLKALTKTTELLI